MFFHHLTSDCDSEWSNPELRLGPFEKAAFPVDCFVFVFMRSFLSSPVMVSICFSILGTKISILRKTFKKDIWFDQSRISRRTSLGKKQMKWGTHFDTSSLFTSALQPFKRTETMCLMAESLANTFGGPIPQATGKTQPYKMLHAV